MSRRTAGRLLMLLSGLVMMAALLLLFRPQPLSNVIRPLGEEYRPFYVYSQIRVWGFEPVSLGPEETAELLAILDGAKVIFWGFQQTEPWLDEAGKPQQYHLYFSRREIPAENIISFDGRLTYLSHRGAFWSDSHLYRLLGRENRQALARLLEAHQPTVPAAYS